jgi:hypothetical protein
MLLDQRLILLLDALPMEKIVLRLFQPGRDQVGE